MSETGVQLPWFKQPMVWMLIAIPAAAVFAGFYTLYLAIVSFDGMVVDDYYKQGKEINRVLRRDHHASELGLAADMRILADKSRIELKLVHGTAFSPPQRLKLNFLHATRAGYDQQVTMIERGNGVYVGVFPPLQPGSWYLELGNKLWRLSGKLETAHDRNAKLIPGI